MNQEIPSLKSRAAAVVLAVLAGFGASVVTMKVREDAGHWVGGVVVALIILRWGVKRPGWPYQGPATPVTVARGIIYFGIITCLYVMAFGALLVTLFLRSVSLSPE